MSRKKDSTDWLLDIMKIAVGAMIIYLFFKIFIK